MDSETKQTDSLYEFLAWFEVNKRRVAIGGAAALAAIGLVTTVIWYEKEKEFKASEALSNIRLPLLSSEAASKDAAEKLQKFSKDYSGTDASVRAELMRAGVLFGEGKYADAQGAFEAFHRAHPESPWVSEAIYGVAVCLDAQNKAPDAIDKYADFTRRYGSDPKADQARLHLATLYEANNKLKEALGEYDKITKSMVYSPAMQEAQQRQNAIFSKHPELVPIPTNAPSAQPSFSMTNLPPALRSNATPLMLRTNLIPGGKPAASNAAPAAATK